MRKVLTAGLAALTVAGAVAGAAAPAEAQGWHGGWHGGGGWRGGGWHGGGGYWRGGHYSRGWSPGAVAAVGIAGLAIGAALADNHPRYGYSYDYGYPAYGYPAYSYGPAYCETGHWVWDPYWGRRYWVRETYPC